MDKVINNLLKSADEVLLQKDNLTKEQKDELAKVRLKLHKAIQGKHDIKEYLFTNQPKK